MKSRPVARQFVPPAVHWFNRHRGRDMTADDVRAFEVWLGRDPANKADFEKVDRLWALMGELEDEPVLMDVREEYRRTLEIWKQRRSLSAIAAGVLLAALGGWTLIGPDALSGYLFPQKPAQEFRTAVGQRATVTLPDQSIVTLDTDTVLLAHMHGRERRIELRQGRAFFEVAKDRARPFIVLAEGKSVRATGTAFDVRADDGRFEVTLIEGRVRVEEPQGDHMRTTEIRPGWRLAVGDDARWRIEAVDVKRQTSWHNGMLNFFDEPVAGAVAEMNRYSARKIVFRGAPPNTVMLGVFRAGDVETFVEALENNRVARVVSRAEDRIEIAAR